MHSPPHTLYILLQQFDYSIKSKNPARFVLKFLQECQNPAGFGPSGFLQKLSWSYRNYDICAGRVILLQESCRSIKDFLQDFVNPTGFLLDTCTIPSQRVEFLQDFFFVRVCVCACISESYDWILKSTCILMYVCTSTATVCLKPWDCVM